MAFVLLVVLSGWLTWGLPLAVEPRSSTLVEVGRAARLASFPGLAGAWLAYRASDGRAVDALPGSSPSGLAGGIALAVVVGALAVRLRGGAPRTSLPDAPRDR